MRDGMEGRELLAWAVCGYYLYPFVPGEKAKWHQRVTHKHPVVSLLQHIEDGLQGSDRGQSAQGRTVPNKVYDLI